MIAMVHVQNPLAFSQTGTLLPGCYLSFNVLTIATVHAQNHMAIYMELAPKPLGC